MTTVNEGRRSVLITEVDAALDAIQRQREEAVACSNGPLKYWRLADLADAEAGCWEEVSERSGTRLQWRAALGAREHARLLARRYRCLAEVLQAVAPPLEGSTAARLVAAQR